MFSLNQLHCGKTKYNVKQLSLKKAKLNHVVFNGHKTTVGDPPRGQTFAFWSGENSDLIWRRKNISRNNIMIYPQGGERDVMTKGENIHVHTITFPETVLSSSLSDREAGIFGRNQLSQEVEEIGQEIGQVFRCLDVSFRLIETIILKKLLFLNSWIAVLNHYLLSN